MNEAQRQLHEELIAAIENEEQLFNMNYWVLAPDGGVPPNEIADAPATCETASCMAGHIEALRPELTARLAPRYRDVRDGGLFHGDLADAVYREVTGEACPLDFYGHNAEQYIGNLSRADAVAHIRGEHPEWPRLDQEPRSQDDLDADEYGYTDTF